jgi:hypothetical protein
MAAGASALLHRAPGSLSDSYDWPTEDLGTRAARDPYAAGMQFETRLAAVIALIAALAAPVAGSGPLAQARAGDEVPPLPRHLRDTGLYIAGSSTDVRPENLPFAPQYPLWSDGATKRRWLYLPPGTTIDATRPNAWQFPPGTRLWKEFSHGRRIETRFIERLRDGSWRFAAYVWNADGTGAVLAPEAGIASLAAQGAPGGRYTIPSEVDCRACHEGGAVPVLGASALQLSPDRDPLAPHGETPPSGAVDLPGLVERGLLRYLPPALLADRPRIAAASPQERAALGYLHANCGHCHNDQSEAGSSAPVDLVLAQDVRAGASASEHVLRSAVRARGRYRPAGAPADAWLIAPGRHDASVVALRMRSRNPQAQMPPLGTRVPDAEGLSLVERWIDHDLPTRKENKS